MPFHHSSRHSATFLRLCLGFLRLRLGSSGRVMSLVLGLITLSLTYGFSAEASVLVEPMILREEADEPSGVDTPTTPERATPIRNIVEITAGTFGFSTLATAIEAANIGSVLSAEGPLTVVAPTDRAFAGLPAGTLDALLLPNNRDLLVKLLYNHVAYGELTSDQLVGGEVDTFDSEVEVAFTPTGVAVDSASVVQADIDASNGVIHAVDQVLLPDGFAAQIQARIDAPETATSAPAAQPSLSRSTPETPAAAAAAMPAEPTSESEADEDTPVRALW